MYKKEEDGEAEEEEEEKKLPNERRVRERKRETNHRRDADRDDELHIWFISKNGKRESEQERSKGQILQIYQQ